MRNQIFSTTLLSLFAIAIPAAADQNLVIVSIGDSVAAGEGNPDSFNGDTAGWLSASCHKSVNNGRRFASNRINNLSNVSTEFHDFSCSGAGIADGLLGSQQTDQPNVNNFLIASQIQRVADFQNSHDGLNGAPIDILMISIGANDVGFAPVVKKCLDPTAGDCTTNSVVTNAVHDVTNKLPGLYDSLAQAIHDNLNVKHVYFTEYPDELTSVPGDFCGDADDGFGDLSMAAGSAGETSFLFQHFLAPLNTQIQNAVSRAAVKFPNTQWRIVQGPQSTFATHGYCTPLARRYVNTAQDSLLRQGDLNGTMHPNIAGHQAYADALITKATVDFNLPMEAPRIVRRSEDNVGVPAPPLFVPNPALPFVKKRVNIEVGQHAGTMQATLFSRVRTPFLPAGDFTPTTMADSATGALTVFSAVVPGYETMIAGQWVEYKVTVSATRSGVTVSHTTGLETIGAFLAQ